MAQLELTNMHMHTRKTVVKNRCTSAGRGKGVFREFRLCRVGSWWDPGGGRGGGGPWRGGRGGGEDRADESSSNLESRLLRVTFPVSERLLGRSSARLGPQLQQQ